MEPYLGEIRIVSQNYAPTGWALCNGQLLPITQNQALFALLGNRYGGDGKVNFALPDLRGKVAMPQSAQYPLASKGGQATYSLSTSQLPAHNHTLYVYNENGNSTLPTNNYFANAAEGDLEYGTTMNTTLNAGVIATAGASAPVNNMQPYLTLSFMIALTGIWPPRP